MNKAYRLKYIIVVFALLTFNLIPSLILAQNLIFLAAFSLIIAFIGFYLSDKLEFNNIYFKISNKQMYSLFLIFFLSELLGGFKDFFSPFTDNITQVLENHKQTERNWVELLKDYLRTLYIISAIIYSKNNKLKGFAFILLFAFFTSTISRSKFIIYFVLAISSVTHIGFNLKTLLSVLLIICTFNIISFIRGDFELAVLGNPIFTAAGYPTISLYQLNESNLRGNAYDYFIQLLIKPIPGFIFEPFGGKPIFSFNAQLTESLNNKFINDGNPISVFTSVAPLVYYKPFYLVAVIHIFIYFIIGLFFNSLRNHKTLIIYCSTSLFFLHRSNLLDIISFIIINSIVLLSIKLVTSLKFK